MAIRGHMNNNLSPLLVIKDNKLDLYNDKLNVPKYTIHTVARFFFPMVLARSCSPAKSFGLALLLFPVTRSLKPTDLADSPAGYFYLCWSCPTSPVCDSEYKLSIQLVNKLICVLVPKMNRPVQLVNPLPW